MKQKKIAIVTGAYGKIGKAISEAIANSNKYKVILIGRNEPRLVKAVSEVKQTTGTNDVDYEVVDLSLKGSITGLSEKWKTPVHVMVNNAATTPRSRLETADGVEMQFATNVLGYFWMMKFMSSFMESVEGARIINVASYWAGGLDMDDIEFKNRYYNNDIAYRQSKQANRMLSKAFADLFCSKGISVASCHPGDVNSVLSNNLGYGGHESPFEGAITPSWLAISDRVPDINGKYFERLQEVKCKFSQDSTNVKRLYDLCNNY